MTIKVGIIGTGWFSKVHAGILSKMEGVQVQAFSGTSLEKAEKAAQDYSSAKAYDNVEHMLEDSRPDAVYVCVPPMAHGEIEQQLIERNIPFLVEKPLGVNLDVPLSIARGVEEKRLITSVGYHFRYMDSTARAQQYLSEQIPGMALGYWMGNMPGVYWWRQQEGSGGQFIEQTTHIVDLLRYLMGEADEVYAAYGNRAMQQVHEGVSVADIGTVTMKLRSGAVATISNTCIMPETYKVGLTVYTDQGMLEIKPDGVKMTSKGQTVEHKNAGKPYEAENQAFIRAVRTGDTSGILSSYSDSVKTMEITYAALQSAQTGLPVKIGR
jgi:myo-inositol 2-dehydrogenase/D-chiro-inositol 1-dehydrogenase